MVLDGEKNEAVGVLLEERLVCLFLLDCGRDTSLCYRLLLRKVWNADDGPENIFLVR
jgi:hypothetical protein